ncbi:MAG: hypothetical protein AAF806_10660 [Bacteroidota bacterium]
MKQKIDLYQEVTNKMIYTLWTTDIWLSTASFNLEGVFSSKENAINYAKKANLLHQDNQVLIYQGELDNYELSEQKKFSTEFDKDRILLAA